MVYPHRQPNKPPSPTLNAIAAKPLLTDPAYETAEAERIRHMRTCQELIELGMDLAREASHQALHVMHARPSGPSIPTSSAAAIEEAEARARQRQPNYGIVFAQIARSVRQSVALQAHIRAGTPIAHRASEPAAPRPPTHRPPPAHPEFLPRRDATERPDWAIPTGPDGDINVEHLLQNIRASLAPEAGPTQDPLPPPPKTEKPALPQPSQPERRQHTSGAARHWRPPIRGNPATT